MNTKQFQWETVKVNGIDAAYSKDVCVGMATAMVYDGTPVFLVCQSTADLERFIARVFGCNSKDFLVNETAVLPADALNFQDDLDGPVDVKDAPRGSWRADGSTQQAELVLVDEIVDTPPVQSGPPFAMEKPAPVVDDDDDL